MPAYGNVGRDKGYDVEAAVVKYRAVKGGVGAESVTPITAVTDLVKGVTLFHVTAADILRGKGATIREEGIVEWEAGGVIAKDTEVTIDVLGRCVSAAEIAAFLNTGVVGNNNAITWTAKAPGIAGNSIRVQLLDPVANNALLGVDVADNGNDIIVRLATGAGGAITSTAQQVIDAVQANGEADRLVTPTHTLTSTGVGIVVAVPITALATGAGGPKGRRVMGVARQASSGIGIIIAVDSEFPGYPLAS